MKAAAIVATALLLPALAAAQCGVVPEGKRVEQPSSPNIRLVTWVDNRVFSGAHVDVFSVSGDSRKLVESTVTDDKGLAAPQTLSPGNYVIHAWAIIQGWFEDAEFPLHVVPNGKTDPATSWVQLTPPSTISRALDAFSIASPSRANLGKPMREFSGMLQDPASGGIRGAAIEVWKVAGKSRSPIAVTKTGSDGTFQLALEDGMYVTFVGGDGFQSRVLVFEIASDDSLKYQGAPTIIRLSIGQCL